MVEMRLEEWHELRAARSRVSGFVLWPEGEVNGCPLSRLLSRAKPTDYSLVGADMMNRIGKVTSVERTPLEHEFQRPES